MSELIEAAKAVIAEWDERLVVGDRNLRAAVERAEKQEAVGFYEWLKTWHKTNRYEGRPLAPSEKTIWTAAQQAERERIRARVQMAAEQVWKAGDLYIGPQHANMEKFVDALLEDGDEHE